MAETVHPALPATGSDPGPWPLRLALGAFLSALPLVLFGGSVTTLGAGMAVEGWLVAEGHFLLFFPVEEWFRDTATFVEHTHRLFGVLVGLFALGAVVVTFLRDPRRGARVLSLMGLLAVCAQGALGGFRVLENSPQLAFVHGACAQGVLALLFAAVVVQRPSWRNAGAGAAVSSSLRWLGAVSVVAVYGQIVLGAWYRHQLRPAPQEEAGLALMLHLAAAFLVTALVVVLALALGQRAEAALRRFSRALFMLLGLQLLLGLSAWMGYRPGAVGPLEWILSVGHVLGGGLLLATCVGSWMWVQRTVRMPRTVGGAAPVGPLALGEAR